MSSIEYVIIFVVINLETDAVHYSKKNWNFKLEKKKNRAAENYNMLLINNQLLTI